MYHNIDKCDNEIGIRAEASVLKPLLLQAAEQRTELRSWDLVFGCRQARDAICLQCCKLQLGVSVRKNL